jgi:hypothetical protein
MRIKNKKNGTNSIAYRDGASIVKEIIPSGMVVDIKGLTNINQVINKNDFTRGWFEVVKEEVLEKFTEKKINSLEKAKKEAEEYSVEENEKKENKKTTKK